MAINLTPVAPMLYRCTHEEDDGQCGKLATYLIDYDGWYDENGETLPDGGKACCDDHMPKELFNILDTQGKDQ